MIIIKRLYLPCLVIAWLTSTSVTVVAQTSSFSDNLNQTQPLENLSPQTKKLRVGITGEPPTIILKDTETEEIKGIAVEYWQELAQALDINYQLIYYSSLKENLDALAEGKVDLALGNISITPERIAEFDLTQPVAQDNLALLLPSSPPTLWQIVQPFIGWAFLSSVGAIFLCIFIVGNLIWFAEHRHNSEQFPRSYLKGIREGMWCALATFSTVGYGDRFPITHLGRFIAGSWMILSLVIVTSLTAGIATTIAVAFSYQPSQQFNSPNDLRGTRIATVGDKDSPATSWAKYYQARVSETAYLSDAIALLDKDQVDGVVHPRHFLEYYLHQHPKAPYQLANFHFGVQYYGIALRNNSPLTRKLNEKILSLEMQMRVQEIVDNWYRFKQNRDKEN